MILAPLHQPQRLHHLHGCRARGALIVEILEQWLDANGEPRKGN
jgi:hypothetical protein